MIAKVVAVRVGAVAKRLGRDSKDCTNILEAPFEALDQVEDNTACTMIVEPTSAGVLLLLCNHLTQRIQTDHSTAMIATVAFCSCSLDDFRQKMEGWKMIVVLDCLQSLQVLVVMHVGVLNMHQRLVASLVEASSCVDSIDDSEEGKDIGGMHQQDVEEVHVRQGTGVVLLVVLHVVELVVPVVEIVNAIVGVLVLVSLVLVVEKAVLELVLGAILQVVLRAVKLVVLPVVELLVEVLAAIVGVLVEKQSVVLVVRVVLVVALVAPVLVRELVAGLVELYVLFCLPGVRE